MAEAFGAILRGLGEALAFIYRLIPSYGIAIILLTLAVRVVLIPLTVKQIRSMTAMQQIQPEIKRLQQKYKGDRQKLNEELMKLYKEKGVNPFGGCFPLVMQAPVFIALYSVLRAVVPADAVVTDQGQFPVPPRTTICRAEYPNAGGPRVNGPSPSTVLCTDAKGQEMRFHIAAPANKSLPSFLARCVGVAQPGDATKLAGFRCASTVGTGHLPKTSKLFKDIVEDRTRFLGMELACSPTQSASKTGIRACAPPGTKSGGPGLVTYYLLVAIMVGTTYYQQKQVSVQQKPPPGQPDQAKVLRTVMPPLLGFISLNIPAGVIIYWIVSNVWTIAQQTVFLKKQGAPAGGTVIDTKGSPGKKKKDEKGKP